MLEPGRKAPVFTLESSTGSPVSLKELAGKWVILYFYPRDLTPGCTMEAQAFQAALPRLTRKNAVVLGVSRDSVKSHEKFAQKCSLGFPLLSDPDAKVIKDYGAWGEKVLYGKKSEGILRSTVLISPEGKITRTFPKVKVNGHVEEVLAALDEAAKGAK